jgi:hypothetical protein
MLLLAVAGAIVCLGTLVSTATARSFQTSSQTWRVTYRAFEIRTTSELEAVRCPLTLEGSFHLRTIVKSAGSLIGYVTRATVGVCESGAAATVLQSTLPWHIQYSSFIGVLARITSIRANVIDAGMRVREAFVTCLFRSTTTEPLVWTFNRLMPINEIASANFTGEISNTECFFPRSAVNANSTSVTVLNSATRITLTLI